MAETHLDDRVEDRLVAVEGFSIIRVDRNKNGGGVALYVHNSLKAAIISKSDTTSQHCQQIPEYVICSVQQGKSPPLLVAVIYRPSHTPFIKCM